MAQIIEWLWIYGIQRKSSKIVVVATFTKSFISATKPNVAGIQTCQRPAQN